MRHVFLDTETTSLNPRSRQAWEFGYVKRTEAGDESKAFFIEVDVRDADPASLKFGKFYERHPTARYTYGSVYPAAAAAKMIDRLTRDAMLVIANPHFDLTHLERLLYDNGFCPGWHYRPICIESMAFGFLASRGEEVQIPWKSDTLAAQCGLDLSQYERHTALGDAEFVRDWYDAITTAPPSEKT